ncbi:multidrug effflux MFS transporter [Alcaligenaceae bacterium]|nr:multidrug effflux MFS transporter [Alcaligenaceae bacterium]
MGDKKHKGSSAGRAGAAARPSGMSTRFLLMLIAVAAVSPLGINLYLPSMPGMTVALGVDYAAVQFTLSVYLAAVALGQLIIGPVSDRYGRRPVLLGGLVMFVIGSLVCMLAPNIGVLNVGRVIQALGGCAGIALSRAIVRDLYDRTQATSMIGYVTMGMAVAPMVAPTIGGLLEALHGWRASFGFLACFGLGTLAVVYILLHETNPWRDDKAGQQPLLNGYGKLFRIPAFWGFALTAGFSSSAFFSFVGGAAYVVIDLMGRTPVEYGMYFGIVSVGYIIGNFLSSRFVAKTGPQRMIRLGASLAFAAVLLTGILYALDDMQPAFLFLPTMFLGMGNGLVMPSCIAGAVSVKPEVAGAASGLAGSIQIGFGAVVAPIVGALVATSAWPMIVVTGLCTVMAMLTMRLVSK